MLREIRFFINTPFWVKLSETSLVLYWKFSQEEPSWRKTISVRWGEQERNFSTAQIFSAEPSSPGMKLGTLGAVLCLDCVQIAETIRRNLDRPMFHDYSRVMNDLTRPIVEGGYVKRYEQINVQVRDESEIRFNYHMEDYNWITKELIPKLRSLGTNSNFQELRNGYQEFREAAQIFGMESHV